jgi:hypothetical protein
MFGDERRKPVKELINIVAVQEKRQLVIKDCVALIEEEVKSKKGISGGLVKAAFKIIKALKPGILEETVDSLLDEFVEALQPFYARFQEQQSIHLLEAYLPPLASEVAENLLGITDRRAERSKNKTMVKAYNGLRPKGKIHVEQAVPGIGRVLDKHI